MSISFWSMKQKSPKWRLTAGKKGRYPLFWCFFESNILLMTSPLFCEYSAPILHGVFLFIIIVKSSFCLIVFFKLVSQAQTDSPPVLFTAA